MGFRGCPRIRCGDGRLGEVRHAADMPVGIDANKGKLTALAPDTDIPALLRNGALEDLRGRLDFSRDTLTPGFRGVGIPLKVRV